MAGKRWTQEEQEALRRLWEQGASIKKISKTLGRSHSACENMRCRLQLPIRGSEGPEGIAPLGELKEALLRVLKRNPTLTVLELGRRVDAPLKDIEAALVELNEKDRFNIEIRGEDVVKTETKTGGNLKWRLKGKWIRFGFVTDTHLGSTKAREDVLEIAYEHFRREGIARVFHAGNMVDGYHQRFNAYELKPEAGPSVDRQLIYCARHYPKVKGIKTYFITGDDHEGWWSKRSGINIGEHMEDVFRRQGREDLEYIGHIESDVQFELKGTPGSYMRVMHPGQGTAYAISYTTQKISESLQGGEKPAIQLVGHFHKHNTDYHREVWSIQGGCLQDQTVFMRKRKIQAHLGYCIVEVMQCSDGTLQSRRCQFEPYFDRGYYQRWDEQDENLPNEKIA